MKRITFCIFILAFLLIRPYFMQENGMWYNGDDRDYFAHAFSLVSGNFPSYKNEFDYGNRNPLGSIGAGLMAAPFVFVFSFIDQLQGSDIFIHRTSENVLGSWSQFGFAFAASFYFWMACLLLYKGLRNHFSYHTASLSIILMVLIQGVPLFIYRRPIFTHGFEFFLQSFFVYLLLTHHKKNQYTIEGVGKLVGMGLMIGLLFLVRPNDLFSALMWPFVLFCQDIKTFKDPLFWKKFVFMGLAALTLILVFKIWPSLVLEHQGYGVVSKISLSLSFYIKRFFHILFGVDWGLIYTAPFILIGLASTFIFNSMKQRLLICLAPILANLFFIMIWRTQGGWYGYRYLICAIIPLLVYPLACFLSACQKRWGKWTYLFLGVLIVLPLFSMLCFEGNNTNLTMGEIAQYFGETGWGNNTFQLEIWKTLLFHPVEFSIVLLKGGLLYLVYLVSLVFGLSSHLPAIVTEKYPHFEIAVFIKVILLYISPFIYYGICKKLGFLSSDLPSKKSTPDSV